MSLYYALREKTRSNAWAQRCIYRAESLRSSLLSPLRRDVDQLLRKSSGRPAGVALCLRFRDEALYLREWLEYHVAAGVKHFFLYDNYSADDYRKVIADLLDSGIITLVDWPHTPASPGAEEDCIRRAAGRFRWVGFIDADEFLVVRDHSSIGDFLDRYADYPAVALHWKMFGSSGHRQRPAAPVIAAYTRRAPGPNRHIKSFVRPECVTACRNSHAWYYRGMRAAVNELGTPVYGSISNPPTAEHAWLNHYYTKSGEDYLDKSARRSTLDKVGIQNPSRRLDRYEEAMRLNNEVEDTAAQQYYRERSVSSHRPAALLETVG